MASIMGKDAPWWSLPAAVLLGKGVAVRLEKVEDPQQIMSHGVTSAPGVVIDGKVVHAGGVPTLAKAENRFSALSQILTIHCLNINRIGLDQYCSWASIHALFNDQRRFL